MVVMQRQGGRQREAAEEAAEAETEIFSRYLAVRPPLLD